MIGSMKTFEKKQSRTCKSKKNTSMDGIDLLDKEKNHFTAKRTHGDNKNVKPLEPMESISETNDILEAEDPFLEKDFSSSGSSWQPSDWSSDESDVIEEKQLSHIINKSNINTLNRNYSKINTNVKNLKNNVLENRGVNESSSNKKLVKRPEKRKISEKEVMDSILKIKYCFEILFNEVGIKDFTFRENGHRDDIDEDILAHENTLIDENNIIGANESDVETSDRSEDNILISNRFIRASDNTHGKLDESARLH